MEALPAVERALARVAELDGEILAWAHVDADAARRDAVAVDASAQRLPLQGLVLGVKDVFDTADHPTEYGSGMYAGHRPRGDAAAVAMLRRGGAVCLGKTVTAEFAMFHPGPTRNPRRLTHTPGGSSSGSAAAVAAGMADVALGTQTGGSIIRPASFCGVWGFKPTFGSVSTAGMKLLAPSLDTVGWFARSVAELDLVRTVLTGRSARPSTTVPRLGLVRTEQWNHADKDCQRAVEEAAARARAAGADVVELALPRSIDGVADAHEVMHAYEAARALSWERERHGAELSAPLRNVLDWGAAIDPSEYDRVRQEGAHARWSVDEVFTDVDVLLTPAVVGEAPAGLASTGDPRFARLWTLLGWPSLSVPGLSGATGLPIGMQLVAPFGADDTLLAFGEWLGSQLR